MTPTILFDLDGTLVDSIDLIVAAAMHAFASRPGPAPTEAEIRRTIGRPLTTQFGPWLADDNDLPFLIAQYREYQLEHHDRLTSAYDGIPDAVAALDAAGCAMAIVTSKVGFMAERALAHVGLRRYIRLVIASDSTERHKPEPEPVLLAMERLGARAESTIFVGDSPYDITAGLAAGVRTVGVAWGAFSPDVLREAGAAEILERPAELVRLGG
ncbi:MAG TPA: HAD-IA family hydrolase [Gemmatimonadaceae bacterium]